ncbi:MAG: PD40 domain-containing protein, partial [Acidobacteria bacterium]|nr:PD40 domain-containing protein [Acidobacteriota bacterium]
GSNRFPLWSPDGTRVVFSSDRHQEGPEEQHVFFADHQIYWMPADGSGEAERLTYGEHKYGPQKWTPDGKTLSIYEIHPETYRDIWMLPMEGDRKPWPFLRTPNLEGGIGFSADGRWLAHTSNETGQYEIVIRGYPSTEPKVQVSTAGGVELVWPLGSKELFYRNGNTRMAVEIATTPALKVGTPRVLFEGDFVESPGSRANWDSLDGQRFIMVRKAK